MEQQQRGFRPKTINAVLHKKFKLWLESIKDEEIKKLVRKNTIITGGSIVSMMMGTEINDFDIYFADKETVKKVAKYYVDQFNLNNGTDYSVIDGADFKDKTEDQRNAELGGAGYNLHEDRIKVYIKSSGVAKEKGTESEAEDVDTEPIDTILNINSAVESEPETKPAYRPIYLSSNAITLSDKIQIILRFYGEAATIHQNYDFAHCTNYWTPDAGLETNKAALESMMARELVYIGSKYPIASLIRIRKFVKRGWVINAGQILKIAYQVSKLNLDDVYVLEDQLTGVDVAYFNQLVDALKAQKANHPDWVLNYGYLVTVIDKMF